MYDDDDDDDDDGGFGNNRREIVIVGHYQNYFISLGENSKEINIGMSQAKHQLVFLEASSSRSP